jgi:cyclophilin family peptidyl-prolyl cis-trans isomerase
LVTASSGHSSEKKKREKDRQTDRRKELGGLAAEEETSRQPGSQGHIPKGRDKTLISLASSEKMRQSNHSNTSDFFLFLLFFSLFFFLVL